MKKTKVFLGAYINYMNAQNINCRSISRHLDKNKYEVKTLIFADSPLIKVKNVETIKVSNNKVSIFLSFLRGLIWADVAYLPKHQSTPVLALKISKIFRTKLFTTIEGNMCDVTKRNMIDSFGGVDKMQRYFSLIPNIYGITKFIVKHANCGVILNQNPLYLGVEKKEFLPIKKNSLRNIVFIGSLIRRKKVEELFLLAKLFPKLNFHIIGNKKYINVRRSRRKIELDDAWRNKDNDASIEVSDNINFHGKLDHEGLAKVLRSMDLLFLPSRSEGFPKVILEAASSSIPCILYNTYGAEEWITNEINGFIINEFDEAVSMIKRLIQQKDLFIKNSEGALTLSDQYDWQNLIKNWEMVIDNLK